MKKYYIYVQKALVLQTEVEYIDLWGNDMLFQRPLRYVCLWSPYECLGYVEGTRELSTYLGSDEYVHVQNSFSYSHHQFTVDTNRTVYGCFHSPESVMKRYVILDERGRIRNYRELIRNVKKGASNHHRRRSYQYRYAENASEIRQSLTPEEIRETRDVYGIRMNSIKPKRKDINWASTEGYRKASRCWKDQSKRKHQYR